MTCDFTTYHARLGLAQNARSPEAVIQKETQGKVPLFLDLFLWFFFKHFPIISTLPCSRLDFTSPPHYTRRRILISFTLVEPGPSGTVPIFILDLWIPPPVPTALQPRLTELLLQ
jgi:hypothetical protein